MQFETLLIKTEHFLILDDLPFLLLDRLLLFEFLNGVFLVLDDPALLLHLFLNFSYQFLEEGRLLFRDLFGQQ